MDKLYLEVFNKEMNLGESYYLKSDYSRAFYHFERSHIIGQKFLWPHLKTHFWMLKIGIRKKDTKEILGQIFRIPLAIIGSAVGVVPVGNSGGANVSAFKRMKIPKDLKITLGL